MKLTHDPVRLQASEAILAALLKAYPTHFTEAPAPSVADLYQALVEPPNPEMGDLAFGCFTFSKIMKTGPALIAKQLQANIVLNAVIEKAEAAGPYLNLSLKMQAIGEQVLSPIL